MVLAFAGGDAPQTIPSGLSLSAARSLRSAQPPASALPRTLPFEEPGSTSRWSLVWCASALGLISGASRRRHRPLARLAAQKPVDGAFSGGLLSGASPAFSVDFPYPHWAWQHAIARFEAGRLATSGAVAPGDLAEAWELHYKYGYVAHAAVEDEHIFPALRPLPGGAEAVERLEAQHQGLSLKIGEINEAISTGNNEALPGLLREWATLINEHMDTEEELVVPLLSGNVMPEDVKAALSKTVKDNMKDAPGSKMILSLFQDLSAHWAIRAQYEKAFPAILRLAVIPLFATFDKQYADHKRVFGDLASGIVAPAF